MGDEPAEIRSGDLGTRPGARAYRAEILGEILVERVTWGEGANSERDGMRLAGSGYIWFRFWLPRSGQVVERYYAPDGELLGTRIEICTAPTCDGQGCRARGLLLNLWLRPDGLLTLYGEAAFEQAAREGRLSGAEVEHAEQRVRMLTASIAQSRFPPPMVRNWQVDRRRLAAGDAASAATAGDPPNQPAK